MAVADYQKPWVHLSKDHEIKDKEIQQVLNAYRHDKTIKYMSYAILGTCSSWCQWILFIRGRAEMFSLLLCLPNYV